MVDCCGLIAHHQPLALAVLTRHPLDRPADSERAAIIEKLGSCGYIKLPRFERTPWVSCKRCQRVIHRPKVAAKRVFPICHRDHVCVGWVFFCRTPIQCHGGLVTPQTPLAICILRPSRFSDHAISLAREKKHGIAQ